MNKIPLLSAVCVLASVAHAQSTGYPGGAIDVNPHVSVNPMVPGSQAYDSPLRWSYQMNSETEYRLGNSDFVMAQVINQVLGSGFDTAILSSAGGSNTNLQIFTENLNTHGPIQIGGANQMTINHNGTDDTVADTKVVNGIGNDRGDNEGGIKPRRWALRLSECAIRRNVGPQRVD